ncbi:DUF2953 domain-containing protein [Clostridium gasigenes]|uniref:DUF2953 domain-containing protein n=1 Tax=Clostridium gasigenes TaxID=94869 RepID=A0A1H0N257_9CLOT|nr:DUF2953 domain-containing protein [Clostridium gasigenes]SDO86460.1 Protein of unknown function [Clostridium gasigenes]
MSILLVFLVLLSILLVPIPIKLTIHFSKNCFYIKFYKILLFSSEEDKINILIKKLSIKISSKYSKKANKKKEKYQKQRHNPLSKKLKNKKLSIFKLYKNLTTNTFKPKFKLRGDVNFELEDEAITAITYGVASNLIPLLYFSFSKIFKVKDLSLQINPHFTGKNLLNFTITSIISFNIAKIIYILILTIKSFKNKKEVDP